MAKNTGVKVEFIAHLQNPISNEVYVLGSTKELGAWDPKKAVKLTYKDELNGFYVGKMLPEGQNVEFKFLSAKSFENVEKGTWGEEMANRNVYVTKGAKVDVTIMNFAK